MRNRIIFALNAIIWASVLLFAYSLTARAQTSGDRLQPASSRRIQPQGTITLQVLGSGTAGQLTKWTGVTSTSSIIGDSIITETKTGQIGIGTKTPASKLTVQGIIETTLGGLKFPDGTIQTTAASSLAIPVPLVLSGDVAAPILKATNGSGIGAEITGGFGGSTAVVAQGGLNLGNPGGTGIAASGGGALGSGATGGIGVMTQGGASELAKGGVAIFALHGQRKDLDPAFDGLAGLFTGDVQVTGNLSKGGGSFKIDHPLDPENKYLYHSFVESPDMMNIYNGNVTTDVNGHAVVELPAYFEALNRDFRYQLTVIGTFAQAIVAEEVSGNRFTIKTSAPGVRVSWQVTGVRQDPYANRHRIPVEEAKTETERGHYLYPELFNQPEEKSIEWAHYPELMRRMKAQRDQKTDGTRQQ